MAHSGPDPIIVALDGKTFEQSLAIAELLHGVPGVWGMKVNDLLACEKGPWKVIEALKKIGHKVFADPKIHDIPETAARWAARYRVAGADFLTVHASGGPEMVSACVTVSGEMRILAVTVPTSLDESACTRIYGMLPQKKVLDLMDFMTFCEHKPHGFVCSPLEVGYVRGAIDRPPWGGGILVTPGIRFAGGEAHDQKRVATPASAIRDGATHLVMGRPILEGDAQENVARAMREIREALPENTL